MSSEPPSIPSVPEIDEYGGDDLPTYDDLAAQKGPNSRFGRWREWIEKRAAERYADITPDEYHRRKQRGWGDNVNDQPPSTTAYPSQPGLPTVPGTSIPGSQLHIQTDWSSSTLAISPPASASQFEPAPSIGETVSPTRLRVHHFGSRFLPHSTAPIRCLLPLLQDRLLLIGHDDGLSVLNLFPKEWSDKGLVEKGPNDAQARPVWKGEGVLRMTVLEQEDTFDGTPQGVVLALIAPECGSPKDQECVKTLRMYNLASLVSLAKWASVQPQGYRPLDLRHHPSAGKPSQFSPRKHRPRPSLPKGLKNLMAESPSSYQPPPPQWKVDTQALTDPSSSTFVHQFDRVDTAESSTSVDSSWDVIDDLPLRWATDFVPLAASRLGNSSVLSYALWRDEKQRWSGTYLAVAVKSNILLYEAPRGERAFRFIREFYTPLTARNISFIQQSVQDSMVRSPSDVSPRMPGYSQHRLGRHAKGLSVGNSSQYTYPHQLTLFVVFEKKAGLIRIADAAVGEVELYDESSSGSHTLLTPSSTLSPSHGRKSWDGRSFLREPKVSWIPPVKVNLLGSPSRLSYTQSMYLLTRGKQSHILPYPLPASLSSLPPYRTFNWSVPPTHVCTRVCRPPGEVLPFLQVIAFGEEGLEVQEISLQALSERKGKSRAEEPLRALADIGGDTGFLTFGGHWHRPFYSDDPPPSAASFATGTSVESLSTETLVERMQAEEGIYGWVRKGHEDWRIFWVGGTGAEHDEDNATS